MHFSTWSHIFYLSFHSFCLLLVFFELIDCWILLFADELWIISWVRDDEIWKLGRFFFIQLFIFFFFSCFNLFLKRFAMMGLPHSANLNEITPTIFYVFFSFRFTSSLFAPGYLLKYEKWRNMNKKKKKIILSYAEINQTIIEYFVWIFLFVCMSKGRKSVSTLKAK